MTTIYRNFDTGEFFTMEELKGLWKQFEYELSFEDWFDDLLHMGRERTGGLEEVTHIVRRVGGEDDGAVIDAFDNETDAIVFAREYDDDHADEADYIGVSIYTADGTMVENWI